MFIPSTPMSNSSKWIRDMYKPTKAQLDFINDDSLSVLYMGNNYESQPLSPEFLEMESIVNDSLRYMIFITDKCENCGSTVNVGDVIVFNLKGKPIGCKHK